MNESFALPRIWMARFVFGFLLLFLFYEALHNGLVHQWEQPPIHFSGADNTFWLLHLLYIPQAIMRSSTLSLIFDLILILSTLLFFINPDRTVFACLATICFWLYHICYCDAGFHHYNLVGYLLLPIPFMVKQEVKFYYLWKCIRYWAAFLFLTAGVYKLYYGGFFNSTNMVAILRGAVHQSGLRDNLIIYLVNHPFVAQLFYQGACLLQLSFLLAFFTEKYDRILIAFLMIFFLFDLLLLNIPFWENFLLVATFLPWKSLSLKYAGKIRTATERLSVLSRISR